MDDEELISFDYAIKFFLKDKGDYDVVESFISELIGLRGYPPIKIKALIDTESIKESTELKTSIADIIVEDADGVRYIVEIQRTSIATFMHKAHFNVSRLTVDSARKSDDFSKIKKIFHVSILHFIPRELLKTAPIHHGKTFFHLINTHNTDNKELEYQAEYCPHAEILPEYFIICIPAFDDRVISQMDEWLYIFKNSRMREECKSPIVLKANERLKMLVMTPAELSEYTNFMTQIAVRKSELEYANAEGKAEGLAEGRDEAIRQSALKMLENGLSIEMISSITGLTVKEITNLKNCVM